MKTKKAACRSSFPLQSNGLPEGWHLFTTHHEYKTLPFFLRNWVLDNASLPKTLTTGQTDNHKPIHTECISTNELEEAEFAFFYNLQTFTPSPEANLRQKEGIKQLETAFGSKNLIVKEIGGRKNGNYVVGTLVCTQETFSRIP